jgi:hypothetical protein
MKPDWKDAPTWANWLAMDADGDLYWYEKRPARSIPREKWIRDGGQMVLAGEITPWDETLEQRPEAKP